MSTRPSRADAAGRLRIGDDLQVNRLGYGAMQITGEGVWGDPPSRPGAVAVLRRAAELGVDFFDTADSYGPHVSEELIREALHPYDGIVVATKAGLARTGPGQWHPLGRPEYLRQQAELSLRRLGTERLDLFQLHRVDPQVPLEESIGELAALQKEGKIAHVGMSEVSVAEIEAARAVAEIASVQNLYNLANRQSEDVLEYCEANGIVFIPWFPVATGQLARPGGVLDGAAERFGATPAQLALAWLLRRSPVMLPIPGTKSIAHVEENVAAASVRLSDAQYAELLAAG
jgi:pyridoxine 4-dehydrogenase